MVRETLAPLSYSSFFFLSRAKEKEEEDSKKGAQGKPTISYSIINVVPKQRFDPQLMMNAVRL